MIQSKYTNPAFPGSFAGFNSFGKNFKNKDKKLAKNTLKNIDAYYLHKPANKKFKRNQIIVSGLNDTWQADLIDMKTFSDENDGIKYLLTVIDVFSKKAWALPLKNKFGTSIIEAFKSIFQNEKPKRLHTDQGTEFFNKQAEQFFKDQNIKLYYIYSEMKAAIVERFNRTLKEKMWRYFTYTKKNRYIDVLQDFIASYNNTYHRSIKCTPNQVKKSNEKTIWITLYGFNKSYESLINFNVGDYVRISKSKGTFEKGYTSNWLTEIFIIQNYVLNPITVYNIKDLNNEMIKGVFYEKELQKVDNFDINNPKFNKIIKTDKKKKKILVSWIGFPESLNSWITEKELKSLQK